jgi:hypothetical protein
LTLLQVIGIGEREEDEEDDGCARGDGRRENAPSLGIRKNRERQGA